jgi:hypothetical protein
MDFAFDHRARMRRALQKRRSKIGNTKNHNARNLSDARGLPLCKARVPILKMENFEDEEPIWGRR